MKAAGETVFARGEDYTRYVRGLRVVGETANATIQAKNVYLVDLEWSAREITGWCTCPHHADGNFCKHQVAVGLCIVDGGHVGPGQPSGDAPVEEVVREMTADELRALVAELAERDPGVRRLLELRAAASTGDTDALAHDLVEMVRNALSFRGVIDYRRSFDAARDAQEMLDELEAVLESGAADAARPALLRALTRLRKIILRADDSSGSIGDACQRAADLYARSCRSGSPDRVKLAKWLAKFRDESPGWPITELADFVDAFDDKALAAYRHAVDAIDRKQRDADHWHRFEVNRMLLELADHDGDVDRAIELLTRDEQPSYGAIVERLRKAGRDAEAVEWVDRAVGAGRVSGHGAGNDYWLNPADVATTYRELGRIDDAIAVLRREFERQPGRSTFRQLLDFATAEGRGDAERAWALDRAAELATRPYGSGAAIIEIALGEGDLEMAWEAARAYGAGCLWQPLAKASESTQPIAAADLYRPHVEKDLTHPNSKLYPDIAARLAVMRDLYVRGGAEEAFAAYVGGIREKYGRRPSLMMALDGEGL
jgi:uncharacterized Zn finger protein